jgi:transcription elongation factor Elf1
MNLEKESGGSGPRCPTCGSEDVAIRGSQSITNGSCFAAWECKKCGLVFGHRPEIQP